MKKTSTLALVALSALLLAVFGIVEAEQAGPAPGHYFSVSYSDVAWQKIVPELGDDSPEIAILRVAPHTGATHLLIRNPRKMHVPRHWHSANETHTILAGTMVFECEGKIDVLGPGSFNYIPSKSIHQAWLPDGGLVFITVDAPWDINWVEGPPTGANIGVEPPLAPTSKK
jgi:mannose-6-phosphate isomerase-like protein (cupin superfamily)